VKEGGSIVNTRDTKQTQDTLTKHYTMLLQAFCELAETYYRLGRLEEAAQLLRTALPLLDKAEAMPQDVVKVLLTYGRILATKNLHLLSDYELTLPILLRAKELAESIQDAHLIADALQQIGEAYYYHTVWTGGAENETALTYFQQALERRKVLADQRGMSKSWLHIGIIAERQHQPERALNCYTQALELAEDAGGKLERAEALRHVGGIYLESNDLEKAERYLTESLALYEESGVKIFLPMARLAVGWVNAANGDREKAIAEYEAVSALAEEIGFPVTLTWSMLSLGEVYKEQGDLTQAGTAFEKAYATAQSIGFQFGMSAAKAQLEELVQDSTDQANEKGDDQ
jgi:tetratricopeptide (TPR) repeat protein